MRSYFILFFLFSSSILKAQLVDSLSQSPLPDSSYISATIKLPASAAGFVSYKPSAQALKNFNGISFLNSLYSAVPGLITDATPTPQSPKFRPMTSWTPLMSPAVIWDGVPYMYGNFLPFFMNAFNVENVSVAGPSGLSGFGPLSANGGIIVDTKIAQPGDDWRVDFNSYPTYVHFDSNDETLILLHNVSVSKKFSNTGVRFFYNNAYEPANIEKTTTFGQQGGVTLQTGLKRFQFHGNFMLQQFKTKRTGDADNNNRTVDWTGKAKLTYKITRTLNLSGLAVKDVNRIIYRDDENSKNERFLYQSSLDFNKTVGRNLGILAFVSYQKEANNLEREFPNRDTKYEVESWMGMINFSYKDYVWLRSSFQYNKYSAGFEKFKMYPSFYAGLDLLKAFQLKSDLFSAVTFRGSVTENYDYQQLMAGLTVPTFSAELIENKKSVEVGIDVNFGPGNKLSLTYFRNKWKRMPYKCDTLGYCNSMFGPPITDNVNLGGVELKLDQTIISNEVIQWGLTAGLQYAANLFDYIVRRPDHKENYTSLFINNVLNVRRFFGSTLISLKADDDLYSYYYQSVPLREVVIGYKLQMGKRKTIEGATISLVGKNVIINKDENLYVRAIPAFPYYSINLSLNVR